VPLSVPMQYKALVGSLSRLEYTKNVPSKHLAYRAGKPGAKRLATAASMSPVLCQLNPAQGLCRRRKRGPVGRVQSRFCRVCSDPLPQQVYVSLAQVRDEASTGTCLKYS
jgi:hypothetical protein